MVWVADGEADARGSRPQDTARGQDRADMSFLEPAQGSASVRLQPSALSSLFSDFRFLGPSAWASSLELCSGEGSGSFLEVMILTNCGGWVADSEADGRGSRPQFAFFFFIITLEPRVE